MITDRFEPAYAGETIELSFELTSVDDGQLLQKTLLDACDLTLTVTHNRCSVVTLSKGTGVTVPDAGIIQGRIEASATKDWNQGLYQVLGQASLGGEVMVFADCVLPIIER